MPTLRIFDWRFRNPGTEMIYLAEHEASASAAIGEDLSPETRRSREREARSYHRRPLSFKGRFRVLHAAARVADLDPDSVRALKHDIEDEGEEWRELLERVKLEWQFYRDLELVRFWTGLPLQDVVAILDHLKEQGEIPEDE